MGFNLDRLIYIWFYYRLMWWFDLLVKTAYDVHLFFFKFGNYLYFNIAYASGFLLLTTAYGSKLWWVFFFFIFPLFPHYVLWTVSSCRNRSLRLVWFLRCLKTTWDWYGIISYVVNIFLTWNSKKGGEKIKKKGYHLEKGSLNIFLYVYGVCAYILLQFQGNGHWFRIVVFSIRWYVILYGIFEWVIVRVCIIWIVLNCCLSVYRPVYKHVNLLCLYKYMRLCTILVSATTINIAC